MRPIVEVLTTELQNLSDQYEVCGIIDRTGNVYPLGSDTKVLSAVFEMISRPAIYSAAEKTGYRVVEPNTQNQYPDFTLLQDSSDTEKIAVDVKTTYRLNDDHTFSFTLGGYTGFIRPGNETKNIVFPFNEYSRHLIVGFVYNRIAGRKGNTSLKYAVEELSAMPLSINNVDFFIQDKWRIAGDRAGSGNTTNIGSIRGTIDDFRSGNGPFLSNHEFLEYWRSYGRTAQDRSEYSNIDEFRRRHRS